MMLSDFNFIFLFFTPFFIVMFFLQIMRNIKNKKYNIKIKNVQKYLLLLSSYIFLIYADVKFALCIFFITLISYFIGIKINKNNNKKIYLIVGILISALMLCYFKYCNFFIPGLEKIIGKSITLEIFMPLGISFYTFTVISYMVDIYLEKYKVEKNIIDYSLFISFFPKVVSGPIIRGNEMLPQIKDYEGLKLKNFEIGIQIFVFGLFKKIVLADHLSIFVNDIFYAPMAYNTITVILGVIAYSLQIYYDFSGYSDMAIGTSKILGFNFSRNFNLPYVSQNISEFWKRWHISLSSWLQEYIYIPLGGSKKGTIRTCINLLIVMLISGIWHGAGLNFIIWGLIYGILNCLIKIFKRKNAKKDNSFIKILKASFTFIIVTLLWVIFRADNINNALDIYTRMFIYNDGIIKYDTWTIFSIFCLAVSTICAMLKTHKDGKESIDGYYHIMDLSKLTSLILFFTFIGLTIILGFFGNNQFIYGKF